MAKRINGPKCSYCGESCYGYGFAGEFIGGCEKRKQDRVIEEAKRLLCSKQEDQSTPRSC